MFVVFVAALIAVHGWPVRADPVTFSALFCEWKSVAPGNASMMVATQTPTFAWATSVAAANSSLNGTAGYQLQVLLRGDVLFDTGQVFVSGVQTFTLPARVLAPRTRYTWRVRVLLNVHGALTQWSPDAGFFSALWSTQTAVPVWLDGSPEFAWFTAALTLPANDPVVDALLFVTAEGPSALTDTNADGRQKLLAGYKVWIGETFIGVGPGRPRCGPQPCQGATWMEKVYDGYDVTAVVAAQPSPSVSVFATCFGLMQPPWVSPGLFVELHVTTASNRSLILATQIDGWAALAADPLYNPVGSSGDRLWFQQPHEYQHAASFPTGTPLSPLGYNSSAPSGSWVPVTARAPFANLTAKPTPPINTSFLNDVSFRDLNNGRYSFDLGREIMGGLQLRVSLTAAFLALVPAGSLPTVTLRLGEELYPNGSVMYNMRTGNLYQDVWTLMATTESQQLQHHEYMEFRYGELQFLPAAAGVQCGAFAEGTDALIGCPLGSVVHSFPFAAYGTPSGSCTSLNTSSFAVNLSCNAPAGVLTENLTSACVGRSSCSVLVSNALVGGVDPCHHVPKHLSVLVACAGDTGIQNSPFTTAVLNVWTVKMPYRSDLAAKFSSSSDDLNRVWEMCRYTLEASTLDLLTDSNTRQRSSNCIADDVTAAQALYATTMQLGLQRYVAEQIVAQGPSQRSDWILLPIVLVYEHTLHTNDLSLAQTVFDDLFANYSLLGDVSSESGLLENVYPLVDWPASMQDGWVSSPVNTISNAWGYFAWTALAAIADWIERPAEAAILRDTALRVKNSVNALMFNATMGAFCDGICSNNSHMAFHSSAYSLAFGLVSDANVPLTWEYVRSRVETQGTGMPCGTYVAQFAVMALFALKSDGGSAALNALVANNTNSWLAMLAQGATMTMEMWNAEEKPNLTWSHPWAASPAFLVPWYLFGIRPLTPGFTQVSIQPQPGTLTNGSYTLPTVRGAITVAFTPSQWTITLPLSVEAHVSLPRPFDALDRRCSVVAGDGDLQPSCYIEPGQHRSSVFRISLAGPTTYRVIC